MESGYEYLEVVRVKEVNNQIYRDSARGKTLTQALERLIPMLGRHKGASIMSTPDEIHKADRQEIDRLLERIEDYKDLIKDQREVIGEQRSLLDAYKKKAQGIRDILDDMVTIP